MDLLKKHFCFKEANFYKKSFSDFFASRFSAEVATAAQAKLNGLRSFSV
jgi:hypothetical protein